MGLRAGVPYGALRAASTGGGAYTSRAPGALSYACRATHGPRSTSPRFHDATLRATLGALR